MHFTGKNAFFSNNSEKAAFWLRKLRKHVGLQKVQINTLLQEFHSLVFFGYLKPDYEAGFKKELEKHYETFVQKADKGGYAEDERRAKADIYKELLQKLSLTWHDQDESKK